MFEKRTGEYHSEFGPESGQSTLKQLVSTWLVTTQLVTTKFCLAKEIDSHSNSLSYHFIDKIRICFNSFTS